MIDKIAKLMMSGVKKKEASGRSSQKNLKNP